MSGTQQGSGVVRFADAPTHAVAAAGARFGYRELGARGSGVPRVGLTHLGANLRVAVIDTANRFLQR